METFIGKWNKEHFQSTKRKRKLSVKPIPQCHGHQERKTGYLKFFFLIAVLILYRHSPIWKYYSKESNRSGDTVKLSAAREHLVSPVLVWNLVLAFMFHEDPRKYSSAPTRKWSNTVVKPIVSSQPCPDSHNAWTHEAADCWSTTHRELSELGLASTMHPCYLLFGQEQGSHPIQCLCTFSSLLVCAHPHTQGVTLQSKVTTVCPGSVPARDRKETWPASAFYLLGCWPSNVFIWAKDLSFLVLFIQTSCAGY